MTAARPLFGLGELFRFREMLYILVYREIKVRAKQAYLGYVWVLVQPLLATGVFSVLVQGVFGLDLVEELPYPLFVLSGTVLWQFFSAGLVASSEALVQDASLLTQISFPRTVLVLYPLLARLVDLTICLAVTRVLSSTS